MGAHWTNYMRVTKKVILEVLNLNVTAQEEGRGGGARGKTAEVSVKSQSLFHSMPSTVDGRGCMFMCVQERREYIFRNTSKSMNL